MPVVKLKGICKVCGKVKGLHYEGAECSACTSRRRPVLKCLDCGRLRRTCAKGLCGACYQRGTVGLCGICGHTKLLSYKQRTICGACRTRVARYGEEAVEMLKPKQCCICQYRQATHLDHCHKTGVLRGLLCHQCNTLLGMAEDKIETLLSAISYLKGF